jgi:SAM-dependent methyltransferase
MYYDEDYYERGVETGKSCYSNYRWMPEQTMPMAMTIIDEMQIKRKMTVLDYGCAKGFLVKALLLLYRNAWGIDISNYSIDQADSQVKHRCVLKKKELVMNSWQLENMPERFDFCIAKDVLEHVDSFYIIATLKSINAKKMMVIVPLGENGVYRAPSNNLDKSHKICRPEQWWIDTLRQGGWVLERFEHKVVGIKDAYYEKYPLAHGFFMVVNL